MIRKPRVVTFRLDQATWDFIGLNLRPLSGTARESLFGQRTPRCRSAPRATLGPQIHSATRRRPQSLFGDRTPMSPNLACYGSNAAPHGQLIADRGWNLSRLIQFT